MELDDFIILLQKIQEQGYGKQTIYNTDMSDIINVNIINEERNYAGGIILEFKNE